VPTTVPFSVTLPEKVYVPSAANVSAAKVQISTPSTVSQPNFCVSLSAGSLQSLSTISFTFQVPTNFVLFSSTTLFTVTGSSFLHEENIASPNVKRSIKFLKFILF